MSRVIHFEIPADDPERTVAFYERVFGWKISKYQGIGDYWLVRTGEQGQPGIDGGIARRSDLNQTICNTVDVESLDDALGKIAEAGGRVLTPKMPIPGVGQLAYCQDTEGNQFGVLQPEREAR